MEEEIIIKIRNCNKLIKKATKELENKILKLEIELDRVKEQKKKCYKILYNIKRKE